MRQVNLGENQAVSINKCLLRVRQIRTPIADQSLLKFNETCLKEFHLFEPGNNPFCSFQPSDTTDQPTGPTSDAAAAPALVIWGTDVVVSVTKEKFKKFISEFVDEDAEDMGEGFDPFLPVYMQRLDEVIKHLLNVIRQKFKWHCLIEYLLFTDSRLGDTIPQHRLWSFEDI